MVGHELIVQGVGEVLQAGQLLSFRFLFFLGEDFPVELLFVFEQVPIVTRLIRA